MIETLHEHETSSTSVVTFLWLGMNISMAMMFESDGNKYLRIVPSGVLAAMPTLTGRAVNYIISKAGTVPRDAGVSTTFNGSAGDVTP